MAYLVKKFSAKFDDLHSILRTCMWKERMDFYMFPTACECVYTHTVTMISIKNKYCTEIKIYYHI